MQTQKIAVVFPGQGSQKVGMLKSVADQPLVQETFQKASKLLGYDLWKLISEGPEEQLNQTIYTQPAMLVSDIALWKLFVGACCARPAALMNAQPVGVPRGLRRGAGYCMCPTPLMHSQSVEQTQCAPTEMQISYLAGHSLGELAALVAAQSIDELDAIRLVVKRAQLMQEAVPADQGAMAVILGLSNEQISEICQQATTNEKALVQVANFNAPGQIVIAGLIQGVDKAIELAKQAKSKLVKKIAVSVPSHCALMQPAAEQFAKFLELIPFNKPKIPVIHNVDVHPHYEAAEIRQALQKQLFNPVQWIKTIEYFKTQGITSIIECGPGQVLTGLNKRIVSDVETKTVFDMIENS